MLAVVPVIIRWIFENTCIGPTGGIQILNTLSWADAAPVLTNIPDARSSEHFITSPMSNTI